MRRSGQTTKRRGECNAKASNMDDGVLLRHGAFPCGLRSERGGETNGAEPEGAALETSLTGEANSLEEVYAAMNEVHDQNMPEVRTLDDGTQVQLTPDVDFSYWHLGDQPSSYNTNYLNADNRGCVSCHESGLADLVMNKLDYEHIDITNDLGIDLTPMDCQICHDVGTGYVTKNFEFGNLIHGIHSKDSFKGNCMSCHAATSDGNGMMLWEEAKYGAMQGITFLAEDGFDADISYEQETTNEMFDLTFYTGETNREAVDNAMQGKEEGRRDVQQLGDQRDGPGETSPSP